MHIVITPSSTRIVVSVSGLLSIWRDLLLCFASACTVIEYSPHEPEVAETHEKEMQNQNGKLQYCSILTLDTTEIIVLQ